jgi:hypothetical protein
MDTNQKGDIGLAKTICRCVELGYEVFTPISDHPRCDLICIVNNDTKKIQVKYSSNGLCKNGSVVRDGTKKPYTQEEIDYYAIYLSEVDRVVFIPQELGVNIIRYKEPERNYLVWWYEDFFEIDNRQKNKQKRGEDKYTPKPKTRKVDRPSKDTLEKEVWEIPSVKLAKKYGVSDRTIGQWCSWYNISKPPRGYWSNKR